MYRRLTVALIPIAITACLPTSTQAIPTIAPASAVTSTTTINPLPTATKTPVPTATITPTPEPYLVQDGYFLIWDGSEHLQLVEADEYVIDDQGNIIVINRGMVVMVKAAGSQEWKAGYGSKWVNVGGALMEWNSSSSELKSVMTIDRDWEFKTRNGQVVGVDSDGYTVMMMEGGEAIRVYRDYSETEQSVREQFESLTDFTPESAVELLRSGNYDVREWIWGGYYNRNGAAYNFRTMTFDGLNVGTSRVSLESLPDANPGDLAVVVSFIPVSEGQGEVILPFMQGFIRNGKFTHNQWVYDDWAGCELACENFDNIQQLENYFQDDLGEAFRLNGVLKMRDPRYITGVHKNYPFDRDQTLEWKEMIQTTNGYVVYFTNNPEKMQEYPNTSSEEEVPLPLLLEFIRVGNEYGLYDPAGFVSSELLKRGYGIPTS